MVKYYNINGNLVPKEQAVLGVNDLGIIRGFGIFDYFLVHSKQPLFLDDYVARFFQSAEKVYLDLGINISQLKNRIYELIEANEMEEAGIRLVATGGYAADGYTPTQPHIMILQYPYSAPSPEKYEKGVKLLSMNFQREVPDVKTTNYANGIRMIPKLKEAGALEVLYHDGSFLRETVRANVFIITRDGRLITPSNKILYGITRKKVLEVSKDYFNIELREVALKELKQAKEVFITGSNKKVMPVVQVDDWVIGDGKPGEGYQKIAKLFEEYTTAYLALKQSVI
ncbi:MAG: aminotransferase class IV [Bacteroidota bacterium]